MTTKCSAAALFDLDGVLIDSERLYTQFYTDLGLDYAIPDPEFALHIKGSTIEKILATYFPSPEASADVLRRINDFEASMPYPIMPGVMELLATLHSLGWGVAIVTSSSDTKMQKLAGVCAPMLTLADTIVTGNDVTRSKPDPEGYLLGASRLGADIRDCVVFEDSLSGLEAGMASGASVVGLATTLPAGWLQGRAHMVIDSFVGFDPRTALGLNKL